MPSQFLSRHRPPKRAAMVAAEYLTEGAIILRAMGEDMALADRATEVAIIQARREAIDTGPISNEGRPASRTAPDTSRIGGKVRTTETSPDLYRVNLAAVLVYVLKGEEPGASSALMTSDNPFVANLALSRHGEGGRVIGKRCGWSENIGAAARRTSL